jgi:hypothetical protein
MKKRTALVWAGPAVWRFLMRKPALRTLTVLALVLVPSLASADVTQDWVARFPGIASDFAEALATDGSGNVYVTGYVCISSDPESGFCFATALVAAKYDPTGTLVWALYGSLGPAYIGDYKAAINLDTAGNVYVTGATDGAPSGFLDYMTLKIGSTGTALWISRYHPGAGSSGSPQSIAVDSAGNVYVTGSSTLDTSNLHGFDYATIKYDAAGNQLWVARYDNGDNDGATALSLDAARNVYVTGWSYGVGTGLDYATVKYDTNGNQLWVARYDGPATAADYAFAVVLDSTGNVCVTGSSTGVGTGLDYGTIKYDTDGNQLWVARYDGPASAADEAFAIGVDGTDNIYVTGSSVGIGTGKDYATIRYDNAGNLNWVSRYDGPGNGADIAYAMAVDPAGNAFVTGSSVGIGTGNDYGTVKYDAKGTQMWVARYNGPGNGSDVGRAIALGGAGKVYVTGTSWGGSPPLGTMEDWATIQYSDDPGAPKQWR